jgi:hypothetical protein
MVFDKAIVLIEHQENELFSVWYQTKGASNWFLFTHDCDFADAKKFVKLVKIAHEIAEHKGSIHILVAVMKLVKFITKNQLDDKRLTAGKLYKLYISQNSSL